MSEWVRASLGYVWFYSRALGSEVALYEEQAAASSSCASCASCERCSTLSTVWWWVVVVLKLAAACYGARLALMALALVDEALRLLSSVRGRLGALGPRPVPHNKAHKAV